MRRDLQTVEYTVPNYMRQLVEPPAPDKDLVDFAKVTDKNGNQAVILRVSGDSAKTLLEKAGPQLGNHIARELSREPISVQVHRTAIDHVSLAGIVAITVVSLASLSVIAVIIAHL